MEFLVEIANSFHSHGYSEDACSICHIGSTNNNSLVLATELEILGATKQHSNMWKVIDQVIASAFQLNFLLVLWWWNLSTIEYLFYISACC